ncbi:MAG: hypothetical protein HQL37_14770, partial [Alphaproteobacteria bacterium]|nr:hypothetical protein [Alphaproteobacteria bacterium]
RDKRKLLGGVLQQIGVTAIQEADSLDYACQMIRFTPPDIIVCEVVGSGSGADAHLGLLRFVRGSLVGKAKGLPVLCVMGAWEGDVLQAARDAGATGFVTMPVTLRDMLKAVSAALSDTRAFVEGPYYIGPDRRRSNPSNYQGPWRRASDTKRSMGASAQQAAAPPPQSETTTAVAVAPTPVPGAAMASGKTMEPLAEAVRKAPPPAPAASAQPASWDRRIRVVQEALRLAEELSSLVGAGKTASMSQIGDRFNRLINLMGLIHSYIDSSPSDNYFKEQYRVIRDSVSTFSLDIVERGIERTNQDSQNVVNRLAPYTLGSATKVYYKMLEFEFLINMLGGYDTLPTGLLAKVKLGWECVLALSAMDYELAELVGEKDTSTEHVASQKLLRATGILKGRPAADSQESALQRLKPAEAH